MQNKNKILCCLLLLSLTATLPCYLAQAAPSLTLSFYKNNGYGWGNDMSGKWTLNTEVSPDVAYVEFYVDGEMQQNDTSAPFSWGFNTNSYAIGQHTLRAVAFDTSGGNYTAQADRNFVEDNTGSVLVFAIVGVAAVLSICTIVAVYRIKKAKK